jgi:hypothetical protein
MGGAFAQTRVRLNFTQLMARPMRPFTGTLGARHINFPSRDLPAVGFRIELPDAYRLDHGGPDDSLSIHSFAIDAGLPAFSVRRTIGGGVQAIGNDFHEGQPMFTVTRGTRGSMQWIAEVRRNGNFARTIVETIRETRAGHVFCSAYVDFIDTTPIADWCVDRCASVTLAIDSNAPASGGRR